MENIFITGGGGFIGGYLSKFFSQKSNYNVYSSYRSKKNKYYELEKKINYIWTDLKDFSNLPKQIDILIHCGADTPATIKINGNYDLSNNIGTKNLYAESIKRGCKTIIYLSSMAIYGKIIKQEIDELYDPIDPDEYGISKMFGEKHLNDISKDLVNYKILRLPGIIGLGAHNNFLSKIIPSIVKSENVEFSNLNSEILFNNLFHVQDLAVLINYFLDNLIDEKIFNVCSLQKVNLQKLLFYVKEKSLSKSEIKYTNSGKMPFNISITKLESLNNLKINNVYQMIEKYIYDLKNHDS